MDNSEHIQSAIKAYKANLKPEGVFASFDYCYNYFKNNPAATILKNKEKSCLVLGYYLSTCGTARGASLMKDKSPRYLVDTIDYIANIERSVWDIDLDHYSFENMQVISKIYIELEALLEPKRSKLNNITAAMMAIFGIVPVFDKHLKNYFDKNMPGNNCEFSRVNEHSLTAISNYYQANKQVIDSVAITMLTTDFAMGKKTSIRYPKVKILDAIVHLQTMKVVSVFV